MYANMRRLMSPTAHGILDYFVVVFLALSPTLFNLGEFSSVFAYVLGGIHLLLTLFTAYPPGLINLIPLRIHGIIELIVSIFLVFSPYILGFSEDLVGIWFFPGFGVIVLLVFLITDYQHPRTAEDLKTN